LKKINKNSSISGFITEFTGIISAFENGIEVVMEIISGSFDATRKESEDITLLFKSARSEAEAIFSIFSGIAGIFSGGGGFIEGLLGLLPGGEIFGSFFGSMPDNHPGVELTPALLNFSSPLAEGSIYPAAVNTNPAPVVIVNTQLEKAGMYKIYREGKIISESRP
jgi:hypothetical protein